MRTRFVTLRVADERGLLLQRALGLCSDAIAAFVQAARDRGLQFRLHAVELADKPLEVRGVDLDRRHSSAHMRPMPGPRCGPASLSIAPEPPPISGMVVDGLPTASPHRSRRG